MSDSNNSQNKTALIVVGAIFLFLGLWSLGGMGLSAIGDVFSPIGRFLAEVGRWMVPVAVVALGVVFIVAGVRGGLRFSGPVAGSKLFRSRDDRWVAGVLGGLSEYLGIDVTLVRLAFIALMVAANGGGFLLAYIIAAIVIPERPRDDVRAAPIPPAPPVPPAPPGP